MVLCLKFQIPLVHGWYVGKEFPFLFIIYLLIYFWLCWVLVSVRGPSPVTASGGHSRGERGPLPTAVRGPFTAMASPIAGHRLQTRRPSSCGSRAQPFRGMRDPPRPGPEPVCPA